MSKIIYHAEFNFSYTYQYYSKRNGILNKTGKPIGPYKGSVERVYLEGDEETVWNDIKLKLGDSETKRFTLLDKKILNRKNTGIQVINKNKL